MVTNVLYMAARTSIEKIVGDENIDCASGWMDEEKVLAELGTYGKSQIEFVKRKQAASYD